ncbi:MAG: hydrogenase maturation nickel metallochaperone HypA [Clostridiales bacterium]|nr:hydrogenase maturation nickel metallochaperone HypA [Clostridiales bacterium]
MHELNVMLKVIEDVEEVALENNVKRVAAIVLDIGELCSVVPSFMTEYFPLMIENKPLFDDCQLIINRVSGIGRCRNCQTEYNVVENEGYCPSCHGFSKEILSGRDFFIKEIQVTMEEETINERD